MTKVKFNAFENFNFNNLQTGEETNKFQVDGFAIHNGCFHGFIYMPDEEMGNASNSMKGVKLFQNHEYKLSDILGRVKDTEVQVDSKNGKLGVKYSGYVDTKFEDITYGIENNLIDATSIGFGFEPYCSICGQHLFESDCPHWFMDEGFYVVAKDVEVFELSLVSLPADKDATVSAMGAFAEQKFEKQFNEQFKDKINAHKGDINAQKLMKPKNLDNIQPNLSKRPTFEIIERNNNEGNIRVVADDTKLKDELSNAIVGALNNIADNVKSDKMAEEQIESSEDTVETLQGQVKALNKEVTELKEAAESHEGIVEKLEAEKLTIEEEYKEKLSKEEEAKIEALSGKKVAEELSEKLTKELEKLQKESEEEKLSELREELSELYKEVTDEELDGVEDMDEETLTEKLEFIKFIQEKSTSKTPNKFKAEQNQHYENKDKKVEQLKKEGKHEEVAGMRVEGLFSKLKK